MNRKRTATTAAIAAFTLAAGLTAALSFAAAAPGGKHRDPSAGRLERLSRVLDLTADQTAGAKPLAEALKAKVEPLQDSARQQRKALHDLLEAPAPDAAQVGQAVLALHETREQAKAAMQEFDRGFTDLLTPEQQARFAALKERHGRDSKGFGSRGLGSKGFGHGERLGTRR
jgi:Spy/CpxP family protein refolding chaperone